METDHKAGKKPVVVDTTVYQVRKISPSTQVVFNVCGRLRQVGLFAIAAMGIWPLLLQLILVPESVFGDGHGDRYEQVSYFAMENDHYQVLSPRKVDCGDLQSVLFGGVTPSAVSKDLVRAVSESTFKTTRAMVVNQTTGASAARLNVDTGILSLAKDKSVCFGGVDDEGSVQIEALLTASDAAPFGLDASCLEGEATHMRLRVQSTEFFQVDTMGELNPGRKSGAMVIVSLVDTDLRPVLSSCYEATRVARFKATQNESEYKRVVSVYSKHLLVPETCDELTLFGGSRDEFGCAYSALGTSGAVADLGVANAYSYPAPWRMIQCTVAGECSSLLFTQLWLSEWTVENAKASDGTSGGGAGRVLRHNFVNHKVNEVTVDSTFSLRVLISVQILALVVTAYLTSVRGWHEIHCSVVSPWASVANATTSCTVAKVVRSSYNFILVAQMVLGMFQWRKQLTIDMLVGANTTQAVLRATGCGTLVVVLAINIVFARAGDLKMQEMEPSFAHVVGFVASVVLYSCTHVASVGASARALLIKGMHTVAANEVTQYSGCRGSFVCAAQVSLRDYWLMVAIFVMVACTIGLLVHGVLQRAALSDGRNSSFSKKSPDKQSLLGRKKSLNSFTRFLDDRSQDTKLYDSSTEIYIQLPGGSVLSTRTQLEACGFVPAMTMLFRYRDLPLFLAARVMPMSVLNFFNMTVTLYELMDTGDLVNGLPVMYVADQVVHAHWSKLRGATLSWSLEYYGGDDREKRFLSTLGRRLEKQESRPFRYSVAAEN